MAASMIKADSGGGNNGGSDRTKLPVSIPYNGTGNLVINLLAVTNGHPQREIMFSNDSDADCTVQITGGTSSVNITFLLKAGEVIDERLPEFDNVIITSTGAWRTYMRSGRMAA